MNNTLEIVNLGTRPHVGQTIYGLLSIAKTLKFDVVVNNNPIFQNFDSLVVVNFPGIGLVGFDMADGYNFDFSEYDLAIEPLVAVFKRSYSQAQNSMLKNGNKIMPYGFNYQIDPPIKYRRAWVKNKIWIKNIIKALIGYEKFTHKPEEFVANNKSEKKDNGPRIVYFTRLWDPSEEWAGKPLSKELIDERNCINKLRMDTVIALRERFGSLFAGGIERRRYSEKLCPELIVDKRYTAKSHYLKLMHSCDVCIASTGLHESIGWKTGEYVAAGKAVVSEKLHYEVPNWKEGTHYFAFATVEECVQKVEMLLNNAELLINMQKANRLYYITNLEPVSLIKNCLMKLC